MTSWCFWGAEVKAGEPLKVQPIDGKILHLSQACLGETKKGRDQCVVSVKVGDQKHVLGNLSSEKSPQLVFDLVFLEEFELSHNLKNGSVHFCGYQKSVGGEEEGEEEGSEFSSSDSEEDLPTNFSTEVVKANPAPYMTNAVKPLAESSESESDSDDDSSSDYDSDESESMNTKKTDGKITRSSKGHAEARRP